MDQWMEMVEDLARALRSTDRGDEIEIVQTHISAVLLGREFALKLKKPVDFGFLDYTTLEKRRAACDAEVRLNRRLCPDLYLGVQPIIGDEAGVRLTGEGKVIDYAVLMRRLPAERMLDRMVRDGIVNETIIDRVAKRLADFHAEAARGPEVERYGSPEAIRANWDENFAQCAPYIGRTLTAADDQAARAYVDRWFDRHANLLAERVSNGWIRDGHGDVRCESIAVVNGLYIFDCIEFNERFRCGDVASEAAFLAMDLDARGRPDLGYYFTERYAAAAKDPDLFALLPFYRCYRAFVRGKVLSFRLDEPEFDAAARASARERAARYFDLARRYATPLERPTVIAVAGLSGTGKTSVARALAGELGLRVVSTDELRAEIFGARKGPAGYGAGAYTSEADQRTYRELFERGRLRLQSEGGVVLDATFRREADRAAARAMAVESGAEWRLIECRLDPSLVAERLARRAGSGDGESDANWEIYARQRAQFEPIADDHFALDTADPIDLTAHAGADWLRKRNPE